MMKATSLQNLKRNTFESLKSDLKNLDINEAMESAESVTAKKKIKKVDSTLISIQIRSYPHTSSDHSSQCKLDHGGSTQFKEKKT